MPDVTTLVDPPAQRSAGRGRWSVAVVATAVCLIAGCVAAGISVFIPSRYSQTGIIDAGPFTELTLSWLKGLFDLTAALTVGWLVAAVALVPTRISGAFDVGGYRAIRAASTAAWVWAAASLALVPFTSADVQPEPFSKVISADYLNQAISVLPNVRGYLIAGITAIVIAVGARFALRQSSAGLLLFLSIGGLLPQALNGHASAAGDHDHAIDTMIYHLVGVSVWIGGLLAFLGLARQNVNHLPTVARRYSSTALIAFIVVAASGVGNAWIRLTYLSDLWTTSYGELILVKSILLIVLGVIGYAHRVATLPALDRGNRRPLIRLAVVELVLMSITVGVAATLGRTAPPPNNGIVPTPASDVVGFDESGPVSVIRVIGDWRLDLLLGTLAIVAGGLYLLGVSRTGRPWPLHRSAAFLLGCLIMLLATSSGLGRYAQTQFSVHLVVQLLVGMTVPLLLVLGSPVTLTLAASGKAGSGLPGLSESLTRALGGRVNAVLTRPTVTLLLLVGSYAALYLTGIFDDLIASHFGYELINGWSLLVGCLFFRALLTSKRRPIVVGTTVAALICTLVFGLLFRHTNSAQASDFYTSLQLKWPGDLLADTRRAGPLAWAFAGIPLVMALLLTVRRRTPQALADGPATREPIDPGTLADGPANLAGVDSAAEDGPAKLAGVESAVEDGPAKLAGVDSAAEDGPAKLAGAGLAAVDGPATRAPTAIELARKPAI